MSSAPVATATGALETHHYVYSATAVSTPGRMTAAAVQKHGEDWAHDSVASPRSLDTTAAASRARKPPAEADLVAALQQQVQRTRQQLGSAQTDLEENERKLSASLLSIKLYWGPELDKERRLRQTDSQRADAAEILLREQLGKGQGYMQRLNTLQDAYQELEHSARTKSEIEEQLRTRLERELGIALQLANSKGADVVDPSPLKTQVLRKDAEIASLRLQVHELREAAEAAASPIEAAGADDSLRVAVASMESQLVDANVKAVHLQECIDNLSSELTDARAARDRAQAAVQDRELLQAARDRVTQELATLRAQHREAAELREQEHAHELQEVRADTDALRTDRDALLARLQEEQGERARLLSRVADDEGLRDTLAEREEGLLLLQERVRQLAAGLEAQQAHTRRAESDLAAVREGREHTAAVEAGLREEGAALQARLEIAERQTAALRQALQDTRVRAETLEQTALPAAEARVDALEAEARTLRSAVAQAEAQRVEARKADSEGAAVAAALRDRINSLEMMVRSRDDRAAQLDGELQALKQAARLADATAAQLAAKAGEAQELTRRLEDSQLTEQQLQQAHVDNAALAAQISELQQAREQPATALQAEAAQLRVDGAAAAAKAAALAAQLEQLRGAEVRAEGLAVSLAASEASAASLQQRLQELATFKSLTQSLQATVEEQTAVATALQEQHTRAIEERECMLAALRARVQDNNTDMVAARAEHERMLTQLQTEIGRERSHVRGLEARLGAQQAAFELKEESLVAATAEIAARLQRAEQGLAAAEASCQRECAAAAMREEDHAMRVNSLLEDVEAKDTLVASLHVETRKLGERVKAVRRQQKQDQEARLQHDLAAAAKAQGLEEALVAHREQLATAKANCVRVKRTLEQSQADRSSLQVAKDKAEEALRASVETIKGLGMKLAEGNQVIGQLKASYAKKEQEAQDRATTVAELTEALVFEKTSLLLMKVEDKDSKIADLERQGAKKHAQHIAKLQIAREEDVRALKEQFDRRSALATTPDNSLVDKATEEAHDWAGELEVSFWYPCMLLPPSPPMAAG